MLDTQAQDRRAQVSAVVELATQTSARALARITAVRSAAMAITKEVAEVSAHLKELDGLGTKGDTKALLSRAGAAASDCAGSLEALKTWELQALLQTSERRALEMKFISLMVKTDAATASTQSARANSFAEDLEKLANSARNTTRAVTEAASPIAAKIKSAKLTLSACGDALTRQTTAIARQERLCDELRQTRDHEMSAFEAEARAVAETSSTEISALVPRLQFADAFSQRLNNVRRFLEAAEDQGKDNMPAILALASLQLKGLATDCVFERGAASQALTTLRDACRKAQGILVADNSTVGIQAWVEAMADRVAMTSATIDTARSQMGLAFERIDDAFSATANVTTAIHDFEDLVKKLHIESLNGAIAVNQSRASHSATYVLAAEVRSAATQTAENLRACTQELALIDDTLSKIDRSVLECELSALSEAQDQARKDQDAQARNLAAQAETRLKLSENIVSVVAACTDALEAFSQNQAVEKALAELSETLSTEPVGDLKHENLDWIWNFYTTQPERDLHKVVAGEVETAEAEAAAEDEDLDGFLL